MGLRIELEFIWKRLQTRFKARLKTDTDPEDPDHPVLLETVQPITDIDELLKTPVVQTGTENISGGGANLYLTVPQGERWKVKGVSKAATAATVYIYLTVGGVSFELFAGATAQTIINGLDYLIEEGDTISTYGGTTGDTAIIINIFTEVEDAF